MAKSDGWQIKTVWRPAAASRAPLRSPFRFCARIFFLFPSPPFSASPTLVSAAIFPLPLHRFACGFFGDGRRAPGRKRTAATTGPTDDSHESMNETLQASLQSFDRRDDFEWLRVNSASSRVKIQKFHRLRSTYLDVYEIVCLFEREIILNLIGILYEFER